MSGMNEGGHSVFSCSKSMGEFKLSVFQYFLRIRGQEEVKGTMSTSVSFEKVRQKHFRSLILVDNSGEILLEMQIRKLYTERHTSETMVL